MVIQDLLTTTAKRDRSKALYKALEKRDLLPSVTMLQKTDLSNRTELSQSWSVTKDAVWLAKPVGMCRHWCKVEPCPAAHEHPSLAALRAHALMQPGFRV